MNWETPPARRRRTQFDDRLEAPRGWPPHPDKPPLWKRAAMAMGLALLGWILLTLAFLALPSCTVADAVLGSTTHPPRNAEEAAERQNAARAVDDALAWWWALVFGAGGIAAEAARRSLHARVQARKNGSAYYDRPEANKRLHKTARAAQRTIEAEGQRVAELQELVRRLEVKAQRGES